MKRTMTTFAAFVCCVMMMANPVVPAFLIFLEYSKKVSIFAFGMITRQECIDTIKANAETIVQQFDVRSLRLFGSLARNEQRESSDVDVVRIHRNIDEFLMNQIERDGIYIIRETSNHLAYA